MPDARQRTGAFEPRAPFATVLSSSGKPVSAKQNLFPPRLRGLLLLCALLGFVALFASLAAAADTLEESARALGRKAAANLRGVSVSCQIRNLSSLGGAELAAITAAFESELQKRGVDLAEGAAPVTVVLTVTQSPTEYLGVVQVQGKETGETVMETLGPLSDAAAANTVFSYTLHKELLFSQEQPILDVVFSSDRQAAEALGLSEIYRYESRDEHWAFVGTDSLPIRGAGTRDVRGFLDYLLDSRSVFLPGQICSDSLAEGDGWRCRSYFGLWSVRTVSEGAMSGKKLEPWFSAAQLEPEGKTKIIVTGRDGAARLYEEGADPVATFPGWGSEIAAIHTGCGTGWQLLITGKDDWTKNDEVRAMEIREHTAVAVSLPVEFPGPLVALHTPGITASAIGAANSSAIAIDRNLQTGRYEAYRLTLSCTD